MNPDALVVRPGQPLVDAWSEVFAQLHRATADRKHPFRELVISTISPDGAPNSRTVILRGISEGLDQLMIYTDIRSDKVLELRDSSRVSLLFYHPPKKLQLKVSGEAEIHHNDELSRVEWERNGKRGAGSYISELRPGREIAEPQEGWKKHPVDNRHFCVILIRIDSMEFLQLNGDRHLRSVKKGNTMQWIAP